MSKHWRGGERQAILLMEGLAQRGVRQLLICRKGSELEKYCLDNDISHRSFKNTAVSIVKIALFVAKLKREVHSQSVILHAHESLGHTYMVLAKILGNSGVPVVAHRRVIITVKPKFSNRFKYSEKYTGKIICISEAVERRLHSSSGYRATVIIPSMITMPERKLVCSGENDVRKSYGITADKIVAYIAALEAEKDHYTFLNVVKKISEKRSDVHFLIVGKGSLYNDIQKWIEELEIGKNVTLTGFISDIQALIPQTDVLLFTSLAEGLGSTILDFLAHRRAVVSTMNGGAECILEDGKNGFLCPKRDVACLTQKTTSLLDDSSLYEEITKAGYQTALQFQRDNITERIVEVYAGVDNFQEIAIPTKKNETFDR